MERPSSSANPMQRLSRVVASDFIQTPWIVQSLHPARCDKQFLCAWLPLAGSSSPESPLFAVSGHFRSQLRLLYKRRWRFYLNRLSFDANWHILIAKLDASDQYYFFGKAHPYHIRLLLFVMLFCLNQLIIVIWKVIGYDSLKQLYTMKVKIDIHYKIKKFLFIKSC